MKISNLKYLALPLMFAAACGTEPTEPVDGTSDLPRVLGPNEKADDFLSVTAQEYFVRGTSTITLDASYADLTEEERLARVRELVPYKQVVIGFFLNGYLIDKSGDDANANYGGFKALTKNGSYESLDVRPVEGLTYEFDFVQEVGGDFDLLVELGERANAVPNEDGTWTVELKIGKVSNDEMTRLELNSEWYRSSPWSGFNPDTVDADLVESQLLVFEEQERSKDAWIDYNRLIEDGTVDVSVFFGWDYHDAYHQKHARTTFLWLVDQGFETPVGDWSEYATNRSALTKTLSVGGQEIEYRVTLWWGEPGTSTDPDTDAGGIVLEEAMREALVTDEVIVYGGHSGPFYGFALGNWKVTAEGDLDDSEIPQLDMPAGKYQIVLAEGCDTYGIGEAFWGNPNKADRRSLDIITTTSFSNAGTASTVTDFLEAIAGDDGSGAVEAVRYTELLANMDNNARWFHTMYGVHGIDDNPQGHPFAERELVCSSCSADADCGVGGRCVELDGAAACTFECTADAGCPADSECRQTESGGTLGASYCVPSSLSCR